MGCHKKVYEAYRETTGTPKERAEELYETIHNYDEYGWLAGAPVEWLEHKIETGEIESWK